MNATKLNENKTTVNKLECLRKQVGSGKFHTNSGLIKEVQKDIGSGRWLKQSQCCGVQGCCDNTNASY